MRDDGLFSLRDVADIMNEQGVLLGDVNRLLEDDVVRIFGQESFDFVWKNGTPGRHWNVWEMTDVIALEYEGVKMAAVHYNSNELMRRKEEKRRRATAGRCPKDAPKSTTIIDIKVKRK